MNNYCSKILNKNVVNTNTKNDFEDLSEGLFDNNWNLNNDEAFKLKFDTYFKYLKLKPGMKILDIWLWKWTLVTILQK